MLTKCRECGKDVSTEANTCPHCGCPQKEERGNIPKCPTCGSTEIEKIPTTSKATSFLLWGPFDPRGDRMFKSFVCKNCKHRW
jgi:predicted RNA-binding Zn-ribbon protein involved in translation (DUF1610 family)